MEGWFSTIKKYLNKKDPIDNVILEAIKKDKLKIGIVEVCSEYSNDTKDIKV